jgi:hypothetical protein
MPGTESFFMEAALRHGPWIAALASIAVMPVGYALVALILERRILRPASEFVAVSCGDPLLAIAIGLGVWLLDSRTPAGIASPPVGIVNLVIWLGFGLWQWRDETRKGCYTRDQAVAPTKIWHQLVVYPILGYWTWVACAGGVLAPADGRAAAIEVVAKVGIAACIAAWLVTIFYDSRHPRLGHPPYDWRRLRPRAKPWLPQSTSLLSTASKTDQLAARRN